MPFDAKSVRIGFLSYQSPWDEFPARTASLRRARSLWTLIWIKLSGKRRMRSMAECLPPSGATQMGILGWIVVGLIAGFIGSKIVNRQGQGFWLDIGLGIVGAIVGGYLFSLFGKEGVTGLNLYSMLVAVAGSVVVLLIYNAITGRRPA